MAKKLRWAVNTTLWSPTREEWLKAMSVFMAEEQRRIEQFVYQRDAKFALVGRLLIRASLHLLFPALHYSLSRSGRGRPRLVVEHGQEVPNLDFNISHQGDYVVLATEDNSQVGVDVMGLTRPCGTSVDHFFHTMKRKFSPWEWQQIAPPTFSPEEQLKNFYRFWTLKESFIKAEGTGLAYGLQNLEFDSCSGWPPPPGVCCVESRLKIMGVAAEGWVFEESVLDEQHCVCVALHDNKPGTHPSVQDSECSSDPPLTTPLPFTMYTVQELLCKLNIEDKQLPGNGWDSFIHKQLVPLSH